MVDYDRNLYQEWQRIAAVNPGYVARLPRRFEGETGEGVFDERLRSALRPSSLALDVGCGGGEFTMRMSGLARVVGLDPFESMLRHGRASPDYRRPHWVQALGEALPFRDASFDVVYSRRGPASAERFLPAVVRVLRDGGLFLEVTIGERNAWEFAKIFGRGQMEGVTEPVSATLQARLREAGLQPTFVEDFMSRHVLLGGIDELAQALEGSPAIPGVDRQRDSAALEEAARTLTVGDGIATTNHFVVLEATKP